MIIRSGLVLIMMTLPFPALAGSALSKDFLPKGFVYLRDTDPTIVQDIRYAGSHNFVGRPIKGYLAAECILSDRAASALRTVQSMLAEKKLSLIVWDCYRPKRAVDDFLRWSKYPAQSEMKAEFYPRTDKQKLFALGYLATRSAHSRGSTVDHFHSRRRLIRCRPSSRAPHQKARGSRMERSILAPAMIAWTCSEVRQTLLWVRSHAATVRH